jgi:hypothetical protein
VAEWRANQLQQRLAVALVWRETSSPVRLAGGDPVAAYRRNGAARYRLGLGSALWEQQPQTLQQQLNHAIGAQGAEADDFTSSSNADGDHCGGVSVKRHDGIAWLPLA